MASSSPPQTPPSASISQNSSTRPISPTPPKPEPDAATRDCVPDVLDRKPDVADTFQGLDSVDYLEKYKKYEADCVRRLQAKYFSKNNIYGGHIFDEKMTIDNETIKSSRWPCTRSYADPVKAFEDLNRSGVSSTAETSCNISNESSVLMKTS